MRKEATGKTKTRCADRDGSLRGLCVFKKFNAYPKRHWERLNNLKSWRKMVRFFLH